jgi:hypothetical protein
VEKQIRRQEVKSHHSDIVRKEDGRHAVWLEAASDLHTAESRIGELISFWPGEFQIMDQQNHQTLEKIIGVSDGTQDHVDSLSRATRSAIDICAKAGFMVLDTKDTSQIPAIAEPFFLAKKVSHLVTITNERLRCGINPALAIP